MQIYELSYNYPTAGGGLKQGSQASQPGFLVAPSRIELLSKV